MRDIPQISEDDDCLKDEEDGKEIVMQVRVTRFDIDDLEAAGMDLMNQVTSDLPQFDKQQGGCIEMRSLASSQK